MTDSLRLRIHHYQPSSMANGPGTRSVLWVQGCSLGCPGCFNPETHTFNAGKLVTVASILAQIRDDSPKTEGVTISGGEPLQQMKPLTQLVSGIRQHTSLSIILFSGYSWPEIQGLPHIDGLLPYLDVIIAGRYQADQRVASRLIGSANKTTHFLTPRYTLADFQSVPQAEVYISPEGEVLFSGIDPLQW